MDPNGNGMPGKPGKHKENLWVVWWILITIGCTLAIIVITFVCLKSRYTLPGKARSRYSMDGEIANSNTIALTDTSVVMGNQMQIKSQKAVKQKAIEMNQIPYHCIKKHTITSGGGSSIVPSAIGIEKNAESIQNSMNSSTDEEMEIAVDIDVDHAVAKAVEPGSNI